MKLALGSVLIGWALTAGMWKAGHQAQKKEIEIERAKGQERFDFVVAYYRANYMLNEACVLEIEKFRRICEECQ